MCLFGLFRRKKKKRSVNRGRNPNANSFGERMDRLTKKGDLPYGWSYANHDFTEKIEKEYKYFYESYYKQKKNGVLQEYAALKSLVQYTEDVIRLCARKGECFRYWASCMIADANYLSELKDRLKYIEEHQNELIQQEKILKKLRSDLKRIIRSEPGIIQASLYKRFSPDMKHHISNEIYLMHIDGIIERTKSGKSYALYMK